MSSDSFKDIQFGKNKQLKKMLKTERKEKAKARSKSRSFDRFAKTEMISEDSSDGSFVKKTKESKKGFKKMPFSEAVNEIIIFKDGKTSLNDEKVISKYLSSDKIESLKELVEKMNKLESSEVQDDYNDQEMTALSYDLLYFLDEHARIKIE